MDGEILDRRNPANNDEVVSQYHDGNPQIMDNAIGSAQDAFPRWSQETTRRDRGQMVSRAAELLDSPSWRARFETTMIEEIGKTTAGAKGEVEKTVRILRYMAGLAGHNTDRVYYGDQPNVSMYTESEPVGVVGLVTPFNFPLAVLVWKLAPALIAGNTAVVKPSPAAPKTTALIVELFCEAMSSVGTMRMDPSKPEIWSDSVINVVHGGPEVVKTLVEDTRVQALSFTGSTEVGKAIYRMAANRAEPLDPRHFVAEMGGQNALVVAEDANVDQAVAATINGAFFGEGQRCTATSRALVHNKHRAEFMDKLKDRTVKLKVGPGKDTANEMGPLVSQQALEAALDGVSRSVRGGMELVYCGSRIYDGDLCKGNFMQPTILEGDWHNDQHTALHDEIFGPVLGVSEFQDFEEAIAAVNSVRHRHVASLFTNNLV